METIFNIYQCEELTTIKDKITVVINTYDKNFEKLACCILSLLKNSRYVNGFLEHIIVCIHGPDSRTGDTDQQDVKQNFLEELRLLKWKPIGSDEERDMPLTVIRVWSRVGQGQSLDMAMPWIHTEFFLVISEEFIFLNDSWIDELQDIKKFDFLYYKSRKNEFNSDQYFCSKYETNFFVTSKKIFEENGLKWTNYSIMNDFVFEGRKFKNLVADCGSWVKESLSKFKGKEIKLNFIEETNDCLFDNLTKNFLNSLEYNKNYYDLYLKCIKINEKKSDIVAEYRNKNFDKNLKFLVCVCVYDRFRTIANWLRAWNNANKYGTKLAVVHSWGLLNSNNHLNEIPNEDQKNIILKNNPDYYIPRRNYGMDIGAFKEMLLNKDVGEWDVLIWFTDDCIPMNKDFLLPFLVEMSDPSVGLVEAFSEPSFGRTISFSIRKEVMEKIPWVNNGNITSRSDCLDMESLLRSQVKQVGYKIKSPCSSSLHWSKFTKNWLCDIARRASDVGDDDEIWKSFENQFEKKYVVEDSLKYLEPLRAIYRS